MKDSKYYICEYCHKEYTPGRRRIQKYCSSSCRSRAWQIRNANKTKTDNLIPSETKLQDSSKEKISLAGVGNAALGMVAVDALKKLITKESDKAATKGDLKLLIESLQSRYHFVKNIDRDRFGRYPYYDMLENVIVYFHMAQPK